MGGHAVTGDDKRQVCINSFGLVTISYFIRPLYILAKLILISIVDAVAVLVPNQVKRTEAITMFHQQMSVINDTGSLVAVEGLVRVRMSSYYSLWTVLTGNQPGRRLQHPLVRRLLLMKRMG